MTVQEILEELVKSRKEAITLCWDDIRILQLSIDRRKSEIKEFEDKIKSVQDRIDRLIIIKREIEVFIKETFDDEK